MKSQADIRRRDVFGEPSPDFHHFLREHNGKTEAAFLDFAGAASSYYEGLLVNRPRCLFCERINPRQVVELEWTKEVSHASDVARGLALTAVMSVIAAALFGGAHGVHAALSHPVSCTTRHAVCRACFRSWRSRRLMAALASIFGAILGTVTCVVGLVLLILAYFGNPMKADDRADLLRWGWSAVAVSVPALGLFAFSRRLIVPTPLQHMQAGEVALGVARLIG